MIPMASKAETTAAKEGAASNGEVALMRKRSKKADQASAVFWPSDTLMPAGPSLHESFVGKLIVLCCPERKNGLSDEDVNNYTAACRWLLEALYQSYFSLPRSPLALPLTASAYGSNARYRIPFGYTILKKVLTAAIGCGFVGAIKGVFIHDKKGRLTRLRPLGRLLCHFKVLDRRWQVMAVPAKESILWVSTAPHGGGRRLVNDAEAPSVSVMRDRLNSLNVFLARQCVWLDLPDVALSRSLGRTAIVNSDADRERQVANMQSVFLRRIFAQGSLSRGGRFYGGWWQNIPSKVRGRIMIGDDQTIEVDYSGLALSILYAMEGCQPLSDPYDIGLNYCGSDDPRRKMVKRYVNAILNDASGRFKLESHELKALGLTHSELRRVVYAKHDLVKKHFHTGVGLELQFRDSQLAEDVMLIFLSKEDVCLPVHDSFIVRMAAAEELIATMEQVFQRHYKRSIGLKWSYGHEGSGISKPKKPLLESVADFDSMCATFAAHQAEYSSVISFLESWRSTIFTREQIEDQIRMINAEHSHAKDVGMGNLHGYKFRGLYELARHL